MGLSLPKIAFRVGLITGAVILIYQASDLLLIYHYFKFEYYITAAVIIALITGIALARNNRPQHTEVIDHGNLLDTLTIKENQVLGLIAQGKSNKEISTLNYTEVSTVKTHVNNIFCKLKVKNRKDAAKLYHKLQKA